MSFITIALVLVVFLFLVGRMLPTGVKSITTKELKEELGKKEKQYIDVRTPSEYKGNHIPGFKNIPLHQLESKVSQLSKHKETYVICQSGMRSVQASKSLKKLGFEHVVNVKGGMNGWR